MRAYRLLLYIAVTFRMQAIQWNGCHDGNRAVMHSSASCNPVQAEIIGPQCSSKHSKTSMTSFGRKPGCTTELDYTEQTSWLLFLKYLDDLEQDKSTEAALQGKKYSYMLDEPYRKGQGRHQRTLHHQAAGLFWTLSWRIMWVLG